MKHDIFGNGKSIISAKRTGEKARYFGVSIRFIGYGQNVVDTRFSGKTVSAGEEVVLDDFLYCGIPVEIGNGKKATRNLSKKQKRISRIACLKILIATWRSVAPTSNS